MAKYVAEYKYGHVKSTLLSPFDNFGQRECSVVIKQSNQKPNRHHHHNRYEHHDYRADTSRRQNTEFNVLIISIFFYYVW